MAAEVTATCCAGCYNDGGSEVLLTPPAPCTARAKVEMHLTTQQQHMYTTGHKTNTNNRSNQAGSNRSATNTENKNQHNNSASNHNNDDDTPKNPT